MNLQYLLFVALYIHCVKSNDKDDLPPHQTSSEAEKLEDMAVVNETLAKYGAVQDFLQYDLPGPELGVHRNVSSYENIWEKNQTTGFYTIRIRTITEDFSYNGRYEKGSTKISNNAEIPIVKGQFGEHFVRKSGGFYIRTIGYILNENGYKEFVINLLTVETKFEISPAQHFIISGSVKPTKVTISTILLGTLIGGNTG